MYGYNYAIYKRKKLLPAVIRNKFLFYGDLSKDVSGNSINNQLGSDAITITGKDFTTSIPITSSATFALPNTATYKAADTDYFWFNRNEVAYSTSAADLIYYDLPRTLVQFDTESPYAIRKIGFLKASETLTSAESDYLHDYFSLSIYWSGSLNENGIIKGNRSLIQNTWLAPSAEALTYYDAYRTLVLADGGIIVDQRATEANYERMITEEDISKCWNAFHYKAGVKKAVVDYGGTNYDVVSKWYNMSPVVGRAGVDVVAYQDATYDSRPEYTTSGLRWRKTNLNGQARCGLASANSILTNNTAILKILITGTITEEIPSNSSLVMKGTSLADGLFRIKQGTSSNIRHLYYTHSWTTGTPTQADAITSTPYFVYNEEFNLSVTANYGETKSLTVLKDGTSYTVLLFNANATYPQHNSPDVIGADNNTGRYPMAGYIKKLEQYTL